MKFGAKSGVRISDDIENLETLLDKRIGMGLNLSNCLAGNTRVRYMQAIRERPSLNGCK